MPRIPIWRARSWTILRPPTTTRHMRTAPAWRARSRRIAACLAPLRGWGSSPCGRSARGRTVLVAPAGNAGPQSVPLFPAADPNVIAVTATDVDDKLFSGSNRGNYIAVAAPGVDILAPSVGGTYQFTTGTSVASAEVSGVVAMLIERNPSLTPADVRRILTRTAKSIGPRGSERDFGSGLVDAYQAVASARSSGASAAATKSKTK